MIISDDFRNIKRVELSIEKYSQISVYMILVLVLDTLYYLLWGSSSSAIEGELLAHKKVKLLTYEERCTCPPM